ncbi:MAG TPA: hypothetical protein VK752_05290 [Bryobacteraceae bacterium]|jgi:hypothetical protein|nr:hypothetical protein [Bryobacteraceae bacterium]
MNEAQRLLDRFHDHPTFCRESLRIVNEQGRLVPFDPRPGQAKLRWAIQRQRELHQPVRIVYLKPRRVNVSAGVAAEFFHEIAFTGGQSGLVVAHLKKAAKEIWNYHRNFVKFYQPFGGVVELPGRHRKPGVAGEIEFENGSTIGIETARNLDAGRAFGIRYLHLSEYAYYRNARELGRGLINSVPDDVDTMIIKESTANGVGNPFHQDCLAAMDGTSGNEWQFVFFAWFEHPMYMRAFACAQDRASFQNTLTHEEGDLARRHSLSLEQLAWRRWAIQNKCEGSVDSFHQEYPSTAEEAFLYSGRPRFQHKQLAKMPVINDASRGMLAEDGGPRRALVFEPQEKGPLVVYKRPAPNRVYVGGADVAEGIDVGDGTIGGADPDFSVLIIADKDTGEQVAKLRGRFEPDLFAEYSAAVLRWYNWAFVVPEANGPGIAYIEGLLRYGVAPVLIFHRQPQADERYSTSASAQLQYLGWKSNLVTRTQNISLLDRYLREMGFIVHDPNTLSELYTFVVKSSGRAEHQDNCHDDEVFAAVGVALGLQHPPIDMRLAGVKQAGPAATQGIQTYGKSRQEGNRRGRLLRF